MTAHLFWLSFCDASRPEGSQFLGCAIVPGIDFVDACRCAHALGCNPGGEVAGVQISDDLAAKISGAWKGRLMNRNECEQFNRELAAEKPN